MKKVKVGQRVIVYDWYRFAIPLKGIVVGLSTVNDGVQVQLTESNNPEYPIGCDDVWVSKRQLRRDDMSKSDKQTMNSVWKYELKVEAEQLVEMPAGSLLLDVQVQNGAPCLWVKADPEQPKVKRKLLTYGTGNPVPDTTGDYVGTYQLYDGQRVFHVFEAIAMANLKK